MVVYFMNRIYRIQKPLNVGDPEQPSCTFESENYHLGILGLCWDVLEEVIIWLGYLVEFVYEVLCAMSVERRHVCNSAAPV